jgi:hypothetical protein
MNQLKYIYVEVNKRELYEGCTRVDDLDQFLSDFGFKRKTTRWVLGKGWGDALYLKDSQERQSSYQKILSFFSFLKFYFRQTLSFIMSILRHYRKRIFKVNG